MQQHTLEKSKGVTKKRRVGRGGVHGKTAGRGTKGQKARAGRKMRPEERDIIKRLPKRRGYGKNRGRTVNQSRKAAAPVSLAKLEGAFAAGARVDPKTLIQASLVRRTGGTSPRVKILAVGSLTKKLTIADCEVSAKAREAIEKAGGTVL